MENTENEAHIPAQRIRLLENKNMTAIEKLNFQALRIDGSNYLTWSLDVEAHLAAKDLQDTIITDEGVTLQQKARSLVFIRHHLEEPLKIQYMNELNVRILWEALQLRFNHMRTITLPASRHDWINLRVQDFPSIAAYNGELFRITAHMAVCGHPITDEEQIEKTLSTLHATNHIISTQYRNMAFTRYSELIAHMLMSERHQLLLLENSKTRPPGTAPPPQRAETHLNSAWNEVRGRGRTTRGRGGRYNNAGRGRNNQYRDRPPARQNRDREYREYPRQYRGRGRGRGRARQNRERPTQTCYRCGTQGHVRKDCRVPEHLARLYQQSQTAQPGPQGNFLEIEEEIAHFNPDPVQSYNPGTPESHTAHILPLDSMDNCIIDSGTTHSILRDKRFFRYITPSTRPLTTIAGQQSIEQGHGPASVKLPNGTTIDMQDAVFAPTSTRNLISFQDIRSSNLHIQTNRENKSEVLHLLSHTKTGQEIKESLRFQPPGLYVTHIEAHYSAQEMQNQTEIWHKRLGHPGTSMYQRITKDGTGIPRSVRPASLKNTCTACSQGKLITRPATLKLANKIPNFLEQINADVCGPIDPPSGPFRFFLVIIDSSTKWIQVSLLATRNSVFARIIANILKLRAQFPDNPIKTLRVDGAGEFTSKAFDTFCSITGIDPQYSVPYVHFQNGVAESVIKRLQMIARPLIMQSKLPTSAWGHAILHSSALLKYRPSAFNSNSPHQLAFGNPPNLSHLRIFGCQVLVPILGPKRSKLGPQRQKGIYVGFDSPSVIRYLDPTTGDLYRARFQDSHFEENNFPTLGTDPTRSQQENPKLKWQTEQLMWTDPRTKQSDEEVQRILHLTQLVENIPDAFSNPTAVTKSHIEAVNTPARLKLDNQASNKPQPRAKRGRPVGAKDSQPRTKRTTPTPPNPGREDNQEISVQYMHTGQVWDRETTEMNDTFISKIAQEVNEEIPDPLTVEEAKNRPDWSKWKEAIDSELDSLIKRQVFGPVIPAKPDTTYTGYKFTFVKKRNATGDVIRYKARMVAKGYTQIYGRDYDLTYSPVMDGITYRYLIAFAMNHRLEMRLMDVVTAYLYGILDTEIYIKAPPELLTRVSLHIQGEKKNSLEPELSSGIKLIMANKCLGPIVQQSQKGQKNMTWHQRSEMGPLVHSHRQPSRPSSSLHKQANQGQKNSTKAYAVQVLRSMNGLKQSGRIWYKRFKAEMTAMDFINEDLAPCLFIKQEGEEFVVIAIYVDDVNIFGTKKLTEKTTEKLKTVFEMKDLGTPNYCLGLQFNYLTDGILVSQSTYTMKILRQFNMEKAHPSSTPMDMRSSDPTKDTFRKRSETEQVLGPEIPYLSAVGALMYLANQTRPDICFAVNLLARHSAQPTVRHWNGIKRVFRYLQGTSDMGLFFPKQTGTILTGFADAGYISDPDDARSQTGYVFLQGQTAISWKSVKQSTTATSSNHAEIVALYEATREAVWLRQLADHINRSTGRPVIQDPTTIFEDNRPCIDQITQGFIKGDRIKHIAPKLFYTHEQHSKEVTVEWVPSSENRADLFTKPLPPALHREHCFGIGLRKLSYLLQRE